MMDKERARYEAMASAAPAPKKPYSAKTVQTLVDSFNETLDTVLEMQPDRLAVFSYAHVPWVKPAQSYLELAREMVSRWNEKATP